MPLEFYFGRKIFLFDQGFTFFDSHLYNCQMRSIKEFELDLFWHNVKTF